MAVSPPRRWIFALALSLLLAPAFAGCLALGDDVDLEAAFGADRVHRGFEVSDVVQHRVKGEQGWSAPGAPLILALQAPPVQVEKDGAATPIDPGGGEVELPHLSLPTYEFRLDVLDPVALSNTTVEWSVAHEGEERVKTTLAPDELLEFQPTSFGRYHIQFVLRDDAGRSRARGEAPPEVVLTGTWTANSTIFPSKASASVVAPPNYDQMRDLFHLDIGSTVLVMETAFRGTYEPARHGTDVDLGIMFADGGHECDGSGAAEPGKEPASAFERLSVDAPAGVHTVMVGAMPSDCGSWYYDNTGPVPYTLTIRAAHPDP